MVFPNRGRRFTFCGIMQLDIPAGEFAGYIFDLDGTLINTMPLHYRAWDRAMREAGLPHALDIDHFYALGGVPTRRVAELFGEHYQLDLDPDEVFEAKEAYFTELQSEATLIEPVVAFARKMAPTHPLAIASGGPRVIVEKSLLITGLAPLFQVVVTADDVIHGKPSPDMFLMAAQKMGVPPGQCLVFEDAEPGIKGALAAGMKVVRVPSRT
ncbi:MAG: beta-phosphoglucomutase family hydrolase [Verrucomicrobia bacterium]|nr:beta-phosphoglucomutase family hydrolase [Verrucomicrobiota bacterium]